MQVRLKSYSNPPAMSIEFTDKDVSTSIEEKAELVLLKARELCLVRIWLENTAAAFPGQDVADIVADCTASGWVLGFSGGIPWLAYQFCEAEGRLTLVDWEAEIDLVAGERRIGAIGFLFHGLDNPPRVRE